MISASDGVQSWTFPGFQYPQGKRPLLMGIVNTTPDSFSDGGKYATVDLATEQALRLVDEGADILDIGGESTRPGAEPVPLDEELRRVLPVVERLANRVSVPISIDTYKSEVARQALAFGARIVNDVSGLASDPRMIEVCRNHPCGVICMHMRGTPQTMQLDPQYDDVVQELSDHFVTRLNELEQAGLPRQRIVIDPGIGFGKTPQHNLEILSNIRRFQQTGRPILIGHSRKRFLQKLLGRPVDERSFGTVGISIALAQQGVDVLRIHDVGATRDAIAAWKAILPAAMPSSMSNEHDLAVDDVAGRITV